MQPSIDIDVRGKVDPEYSLDIALTNKSSEPLTVYEHSLPWVGFYSMLLIAAKTDVVGTMIDKSSLIDDPGVAITTIQPTETLKGQISLASRFLGFLDAIKEHDIVVFWSYQLRPIGAPPLPRTCGCVLFQKTPDKT